MKQLFIKSLSLVLIASFFSCNGPAPNQNQPNGDNAQKLTLVVDEKKITADQTSVITSAFTSDHFTLTFHSEKDDLQFAISAYMQDLKAGTYQVYECASECDDKVPDLKQIAIYGPYPKDPMPPLNLFRTAYYAPKLGLKPLTLIISSITDEQQAGNPYKAKRVEGQLSSNMAYIEQVKGGYDWLIVGKTTQINGDFSVICSMR